MGWIFRSICGDEDLWKVFWIYGVFFVFLGQVAIVVMRLGFGIDYEHPTPLQEKQIAWIELIYFVWIFISLWRCASNVELVVWGWAVRVGLCAGLLWLGLFFYMGGKENALPDFFATVIHALAQIIRTLAYKVELMIAGL